VLGIISENFDEFIEVQEPFSSVESAEDHFDAERELKLLLEAELDNLGVRALSEDIRRILDSYDTIEALSEYFENLYGDDERGADWPRELPINEIDDLFDKS
jgi:hypothetical protein